MQRFKFYDQGYEDVEMEKIVENLRQETKASAHRDAGYLYSAEVQEEEQNITE